MAEVKPLRLKREKVAPTRAITSELPFVRVLIDVPAPHIEPVLDYAVPAEFSDQAMVGTLVEVPFNQNLVLGVIVARESTASVAGRIKPIHRVFGQAPITDQGHIEEIIDIAARYGAAPWDFFASSIPAYSAVGEKAILKLQPLEPYFEQNYKNTLPADLEAWLVQAKQIRGVVELARYASYWKSALELAITRSHVCHVLLIVPDERDLQILQMISEELRVPVAVISGEMKKSEKFIALSQLRKGDHRISISTRSSVLYALPVGATIIVLDDNDPSHYDRRSPGWNTRDIALIRSERFSVIFASCAPSLELVAMRDQGEISYYTFPRSKPPKTTYADEDDQYSYFPVISRGLKNGPVLVRVVNTGYVRTFSCQKCRNVAKCSCGSNLIFERNEPDPQCSTCKRRYINWHCEFCQSNAPRVTRAGVERIADDFGKSFPNMQIIISHAEHPILAIPDAPAIVLSTSGVEPVGQYQAIILLDLERSLLQLSLRAFERTRIDTLRVLSMLKPGGEIFLSLPSNHSLSQYLLLGNSASANAREIAERDSAQLPPHFRLIVVEGEDLTSVQSALQDFLERDELTLIGPIPNGRRRDEVRLILKTPRLCAPAVILRLTEINRVLSMRRSHLIRSYIDPYDLEI